MRPFLANPMAHLVVFATIVTACFVTYVLAGRSVSPSFDGLASIGWYFMLILWTDADARRLRQVPCFDFGFLVWVFFPVSVAWYCVWSRGWRGLLLIRDRIPDGVKPLLVFGTLGLTIGAGFIISALISYGLSKHLGLMGGAGRTGTMPPGR